MSNRTLRRNSYNSPTGSWTSIATRAIVFGAVGVSSYWLYQLVSLYGWEGTVRYIWEGDPHPQSVRIKVDALHKISKKLDLKEKSLSSLELGLERARLDTVDDSDPGETRRLWEKNIKDKDLRVKLSLLSYELDQLASKIDDVKAVDDESIKSLKKKLSNRVVKLMDIADSLITAFKNSL